MAEILIAFASSEGQTARICAALASQLEEAGHGVDQVDLAAGAGVPDPASFDAVVVAASVHAGKHQKSAVRFAAENPDALSSRPTAFVSVGLAAIATSAEGRKRAGEQVRAFLDETGWQPDLVATPGGAFRYSEFPPIRRWVFRLSQRLFRKDLERQGWPDLTVDREFTDWNDVRRFGDEFAARL